MEYQEICNDSNLVCKNELTNTYSYTDESGTGKTVFYYRIPLDNERESIYLKKYHLRPEDRNAFYRNLVACIQRQGEVSAYLAKHGVPSILTYSNISKFQDEKGIYHIYIETEHVVRALDSCLSGSVTRLTLVDFFYRLAIIMRDISNVGVCHRGLDLNNVFLNDQGKILLGGFFYASCPDLDAPPPYLPSRPVNLPSAFLGGDAGNQGLDILALTINAWQLFSGHAYQARLRRQRLVYPEYADPNLVEALQTGLSGNPDYCNQFRRRLLDYRKAIRKTEHASDTIPIYSLRQKRFCVEIKNEFEGKEHGDE